MRKRIKPKMYTNLEYAEQAITALLIANDGYLPRQLPEFVKDKLDALGIVYYDYSQYRHLLSTKQKAVLLTRLGLSQHGIAKIIGGTRQTISINVKQYIHNMNIYHSVEKPYDINTVPIDILTKVFRYKS